MVKLQHYREHFDILGDYKPRINQNGCQLRLGKKTSYKRMAV